MTEAIPATPVDVHGRATGHLGANVPPDDDRAADQAPVRRAVSAGRDRAGAGVAA